MLAMGIKSIGSFVEIRAANLPCSCMADQEADATQTTAVYSTRKIIV